MYLLFHDVKETDKTKAIDSLITESTLKPSFLFLLILSVLMASFGLLMNNATIVIGSMLIAPILSPVLSLALGVTLGDNQLIQRSTVTLLKSLFYSIGLAALTTWVLWGFIQGAEFRGIYNYEILSRTEPSFVYLLVAIISGLAAAYARVKPELNEMLPGAAIAVSLVPPIATIGIGVATLNLTVISGSLSMFIINMIGVIVAAMVMFSLMNIYAKRKVAQVSLEKNEKEQEKLKKKFQSEGSKK